MTGGAGVGTVSVKMVRSAVRCQETAIDVATGASPAVAGVDVVVTKASGAATRAVTAMAVLFLSARVMARSFRRTRTRAGSVGCAVPRGSWVPVMAGDRGR